MKQQKTEILFDLKKFDIRLETEWLGRSFLYLEEVDSTNNFFMEKGNEDVNGAVLLAEKQTEGKGRLDRQWYSSKAMNLTFSFLITDRVVLSKPLIPVNFALAISVAETIETLYQIKTQVKWPNDVLVGGKKIAGILLESSSTGNKINRLVAGIGINVNQIHFQGSYMLEPTSVINEAGMEVEREKLLAELLNNFEDIISIAVKHPAIIFNKWRERCPFIGDKIHIARDGKDLFGVFDDIDDEGNLLLRQDDEILKIQYGDVSVLGS
jgi:BirA family biotin operon repressor/biotin-[acetyl-CoA-carboxylase] ligase